MTDLSELEALVGRATPTRVELRGPTRIYGNLQGDQSGTGDLFATTVTPEHASAIAAAVNALSHLLSTIRSQEAALVELRAERDNAVAITKRVQSAAKTIMIGESDELARLRAEKAGEWVATKTLDSEREANAILTDERDALRAALVEARSALRSIFDKLDKGVREGAPGHSHDVLGIWDAGNAPGVAGTPCEWCAKWEAARIALSKLEGGE